ncbi:hypothetical protein [Streptomyces blattellae]|uniref:hypothetical protein n=1 Tax=Streptomyces blattellae TaxID=2569855 RepID=UPI001E3F4D8D|nr:hypothetical protein [Streptomyces blattellae]
MERQDAFDLHGDGVVLGTLELVDALLLEQVRDEQLLFEHPDSGVHELPGLYDLMLCGGQLDYLYKGLAPGWRVGSLPAELAEVCEAVVA